MSNHEALIAALECGEQCDQDGVMIKVSRQAMLAFQVAVLRSLLALKGKEGWA